MHNCKATRELVTELVLDGTSGRPDEARLAELRECAACRDEFDALKETLRITTRLIESTAPAETYWMGYHARLKQKLEAARVLRVETSTSPVVREMSGPSWLIRLLTSSVRVPLPAGIALLLVFGLSLLVAIRASQQRNLQSPIPSIVQVPVEVPVIQEKIVTRVVYRQSNRQSVSRRSKQTISPSRSGSALARSQKPANEANAASLIGFKPLDEIKLTVIKGGSPE